MREIEKRKEKEGNNQKKCVCVLFISLVASVVVRAINIQFLFVDIFYDVHFWAFFFILSFSQPEYIRNNGSRLQCS
jgi:hypothetical protein